MHKFSQLPEAEDAADAAQPRQPRQPRAAAGTPPAASSTPPHPSRRCAPPPCVRQCCCGSPRAALATVCAVLGLAAVAASLVIMELQRDATGGTPTPATPVADVRRVLHVSDFHLDSYYDDAFPPHTCRCHAKHNPAEPRCAETAASSSPIASPDGSYGCDSPPSLVQSAMRAAAAAAPGTDSYVAAVATGDFTRHGTADLADPSQVVVDAVGNVTAWFRASLPSVPFVAAYGNDDLRRNYYFNLSRGCDQPLLRAAAPHLAKQLPGLSSTAAATMRCGGYYRYDIAVGGGTHRNSTNEPPKTIRVLSLNTILYSLKHFPVPAEGSAASLDPAGQFAWLETELSSCAAEQDSCMTVWLVGHIPPGREFCGGLSAWAEPYAEKYVSLLRAHSGVVAAQFFGHEHVNSIRMVSADPADYGIPPIIIGAAVSPIYANRPSFRVTDFDRRNGKLVDFHVWTSRVTDEGAEPAGGDDTFSPSFSASSEFGLANLQSPAVARMLNTFLDGGGDLSVPAFKTYVQRSWDRGASVSLPPPGSPCSAHPNVCHLMYALERDIVRCRRQHGV